MLLHRIIAWSALLGPLALAAALPAAGAAVRAAAGPLPATRAAVVAAARPVLRLGSHGGAVITLQRRLERVL
jgi:peptidoglycan hydrolase-like protein with peptidoglycan-binding domain